MLALAISFRPSWRWVIEVARGQKDGVSNQKGKSGERKRGWGNLKAPKPRRKKHDENLGIRLGSSESFPRMVR